MALTLIQIRDKADAILVPLSVTIQNKQANWILTHRNYWQGMKTFGTIPVDGEDVVTDSTVKPNGVDDCSWQDFGIILPATISAVLAVDTHNGSLGRGYTMSAMVTFNGRIFRRSLGIGAYSVTMPWTELISR